MGVEYLDCDVLVFGSDLFALWCALEARRQGYRVRLIFPGALVSELEWDALREPLQLGSRLVEKIYCPDVPINRLPWQTLTELRRTEQEWDGQLLRPERIFHMSTPESHLLLQLQDLFEESDLCGPLLEMRDLSDFFCFQSKAQPLRAIEESAFGLTMAPSKLASLVQANLEKQGVIFHPLTSSALARFDFEADRPTAVLNGRIAIRAGRLLISHFEDIQSLGPMLPSGKRIVAVRAHLTDGPHAPDISWSAKFNHSNWLFSSFCLSARRTESPVTKKEFVGVSKLVPLPQVEPESLESEALTTALAWSSRWFPFFEPTTIPAASYWLSDSANCHNHPWRADVRIGGGLGCDSPWWAPGLAIEMVSQSDIAVQPVGA